MTPSPTLRAETRPASRTHGRKPAWPFGSRQRRFLSGAWRRCIVGCLTLAWTAVGCSPATAHETDQYTLPVGRQFADLGPHLSRIVHAAIVDAVAATNAQIGRSLHDGRPTGQTERLQAPETITGKVWGQLFAAFPTNELLDGGLASQRTRTRYPGMITGYRPEQSLHDDPLLLLDLTKLVRSLFRAGTVSVDGTSFGTDKIIHFIHLGHIYYSTYVSARQRGLDEATAAGQAMRLSSGNNLLLSENWLLGTFTTGIRSNADLAANYAGLKFYRNLTEPVRRGDRIMAPMLLRDGLVWRLNEQTRPDSDFFTAFVSPHWNEALNPSVFAFGTGARMRSLLRTRCPDVLDWYRDERGRRLTRAQFAQIHRSLSTWYGEDYGYRSDGEDDVSIAGTCFPPQPGGGAGSDSARAQASDLEAAPASGDRDGSPQPAADELARTPLWWAARDGRLAEVERLLARGDDLNAADIDGEGPLHAAARSGRVAVLEALLAHGADPGTQSLYGATPLQVAIGEADIDAARVLLRHGADPNATDVFGSSPLHAAAGRGNPELVALLLDFGADPRAVDHGGATPRQVAARAEATAVTEVLLSRASVASDRFEARAVHPAARERRASRGNRTQPPSGPEYGLAIAGDDAALASGRH